MSHDHTDIAVLFVTYKNFPNPEVDDFTSLCRQCAADKYGLIVGEDDRVEYWDPDAYPYNAFAKRGDLFFRPGPDWPPSLAEIKATR